MDFDDNNSNSMSPDYRFPSSILDMNEGFPIAEEMEGLDGYWTLTPSMMDASSGAQNPFLTAQLTQLSSSPSSRAAPPGLPIPMRRSSAPVKLAPAGGYAATPPQHQPGAPQEKLERSRQSARECRARKKLRYQYLEDLVTSREKAIYALRDELEMYRNFAREIDEGRVPDGVVQLIQSRMKTEDSMKGICKLKLAAE